MKISKKITKIGWVFLLNLLFLQLFVSAAAVDPTEKLPADSTTGTEAYTAPGLDTYHVDAKAALLVELNTGEILVSQNAEESGISCEPDQDYDLSVDHRKRKSRRYCDCL